MTMQDIIDWIVAEAQRRLSTDACCSGGLVAKIHGVSMEIDLKLCNIMKDLR